MRQQEAARSLSALRSPARHRPSCRGIGLCFPALNAQAAAELHEDSSCVCRSALLWFSALSACRRRMDQDRQLQPSDARFSRTGGLKDGANGSPCSGRETDHRVVGTFPATRQWRSSSVLSARTAQAAGSSSESRWPGEEPQPHG